MRLKNAMAAVAAAAAVVAAPATQAAYVLTSQDVTFTISAVDSNTFTLRIQNLLNATGDWGPVTQYGALGFKGIGTGFTGGTITPDGSSVIPGGLNAGGCSGSGNEYYCFSFAPAPFLAATNDDTFTIDMVGATLAFASAGPHLKVNFLNAAGDKTGDLLSLDVPLSTSTSSTGGGTTTSSTSSGVPEPGTGSLALLGLAALGAGFVLRRKQAASRS